MDEPKPFTVYRHFKGGRYIVICVAPHTETGEKLVCYFSVSDNVFWIRPLASWNTPVEMKSAGDTISIPRFTEAGDYV